VHVRALSLACFLPANVYIEFSKSTRASAASTACACVSVYAHVRTCAYACVCVEDVAGVQGRMHGERDRETNSMRWRNSELTRKESIMCVVCLSVGLCVCMPAACLCVCLYISP